MILLANLVQLRRSAMPGLEDRNFRLGESVTIPLDESRQIGNARGHSGNGQVEDLLLVCPDGSTRPVRREGGPGGALVVLDDLPASGRYSLRGGDGRAIETFAVNLLDERESDLTAAATDRTGEQADRPGHLLLADQTGRSWLLALLIALTAAALLGNWWLVSRQPRQGRLIQPRQRRLS